MGLFGGKKDDTKARIEELKKKIQAEQQAYASSVKEQPKAAAPPAQPAAPAPTPAAPTPAPAPVQEIIFEERVPVQIAAPVHAPPQVQHHVHAPQHQQHPQQVRQYEAPRAREYAPPQDMRQPRMPEHPADVNSGVVLDLGEGMSLNVPVKARMHLDEFLTLADKVRELQSLQQRPNIH